jgi:hypothetical protein
MQIVHLSWGPVSLQPVLGPSLYIRGVLYLNWTGFSLMHAAKKSRARWYYFNH